MAALTLALGTSGCGEKPRGEAQPGGEDTVRGKTFESTAVTEHGKARPLVDQTGVSLRFTDDGRLLARAGCNMISGQVALDDGRLTVADMSATAMGCDPARHEQDRWLTGVLNDRPSWRVDGETMVLTTASTEITLSTEPAKPEPALIGTRWTVDTLVDGQTASSPAAGLTATLVFEADLVLVSTPCNSGSAGYRMSGSTLSFEPPDMTLRGCRPDETALEHAVFAALEGDVVYRIDSGTLSLTRADGKGLQLRST